MNDKLKEIENKINQLVIEKI